MYESAPLRAQSLGGVVEEVLVEYAECGMDGVRRWFSPATGTDGSEGDPEAASSEHNALLRTCLSALTRLARDAHLTAESRLTLGHRLLTVQRVYKELGAWLAAVKANEFFDDYILADSHRHVFASVHRPPVTRPPTHSDLSPKFQALMHIITQLAKEDHMSRKKIAIFVERHWMADMLDSALNELNVGVPLRVTRSSSLPSSTKLELGEVSQQLKPMPRSRAKATYDDSDAESYPSNYLNVRIVHDASKKDSAELYVLFFRSFALLSEAQ